MSNLGSFRDIPIPAGEEVTIHAAGDWLACLESSASFVLSVGQGSAAYFEAGLYWRPRERFSAVRLINRSTVDNIVSIQIGDGVFEDRRAIAAGSGAAGIDPQTVGDVRAYAYRAQRTCTATAGNRGHLQLWNPAGSGILAAIRDVYLHSDVAGQLILFRHNTELGAAGGFTHTNYFGDGDGSLTWRETIQAAAITGSDTPAALIAVRVMADGFVHLPLKSPLLIPEGWGLVARHGELGPLDFDFGLDVLELPAIA